MARLHQRTREQRGAAAVEFALVAPLLLLLVFGVISYGYMLSFRQALSQGVAEGARAGAVWPVGYDSSQDVAREAAALARIDEALGSYGVGCATTGVTCSVAVVDCDAGNRCLSVTVSYPYGDRPLTPDVPLVPLPGTLSYTSAARLT
ncbi:MAG: pilus assembly protein TadE [Nocardioides sp.]|jgi:Flp pilus assembly protein TadG|nr:pilus assembly protein TadE [Nocardioides sp.]|tara:strand:- start:344 stop:787 length:444 start_codon:yes stop_codon:yes gene_type:complete